MHFLFYFSDIFPEKKIFVRNLIMSEIINYAKIRYNLFGIIPEWRMSKFRIKFKTIRNKIFLMNQFVTE